MAESTQSEESPLAASFRAHAHRFHDGLPAEEQTLLEQVFSLAAGAAGEHADAKGFAAPSPSPVTIVLIELNKWRYAGPGAGPESPGGRAGP
jgi:hypothetical protein